MNSKRKTRTETWKIHSTSMNTVSKTEKTHTLQVPETKIADFVKDVDHD